MTPSPPRVLFHAPLKPPDYPVPSGDRTMARLLLAALDRAGTAPVLASRLRPFDPSGDPALALRYEAEAAREVDRLLAAEAVAAEAVTAEGARPDGPAALWFTYHVHYKAPDLLGPPVSRALGIPYVVAEGSRAPKRAAGPWHHGHRAAEAALDAADLVLVLNPEDHPALEAARPPGQRLVDLPPFVDAAAWPDPGAGSEPPPPASEGTLRLLAVAMMREGDKLASYAELAAALHELEQGWALTIVGDGPARPAVEGLFAAFGPRVRFLGLVEDRSRLADLYAGADALVWPAMGEAFGMVFLEAALQGCPAVAGDRGGVRGVVRHGRTGLLVPDGPTGFPVALAAELSRLAVEPGLRGRLSAGARAFARGERSLDGAARHLRSELDRLWASHAAGRRATVSPAWPALP